MGTYYLDKAIALNHIYLLNLKNIRHMLGRYTIHYDPELLHKFHMFSPTNLKLVLKLMTLLNNVSNIHFSHFSFNIPSYDNS